MTLLLGDCAHLHPVQPPTRKDVGYGATHCGKQLLRASAAHALPPLLNSSAGVNLLQDSVKLGPRWWAGYANSAHGWHPLGAGHHTRSTPVHYTTPRTICSATRERLLRSATSSSKAGARPPSDASRRSSLPAFLTLVPSRLP